jgi:glutamyl-tRNA synthetase
MKAQPTNVGRYRGRLAPSPSGFLHLGHARTFWIAQQRARSHGGALVMRNEDLDHARSKPEFVDAMLKDLRWFGLEWDEGPDVGGPFAPYCQSERGPYYQAAFEKLQTGGFVYPCRCSRRDVLRALQAPHASEDEPIYPGTCRPRRGLAQPESRKLESAENEVLISDGQTGSRVSWRFRVPDGETISFIDGNYGPREFVAGKDFGDFIVWRHDDIPAYQLAVVVDDAAMQISEVVRGEDLLMSTARQLLLFRALKLSPPQFYHCPLVRDEAGLRLAKRHEALSLRALRARGVDPEQLRQSWEHPINAS